MSKYNTPIITFEAGAKVEPFRLVKLDSGKVVHAGAGDKFLGSTTYAAVNADNEDRYDLATLPNHVAVNVGEDVVQLEVKSGDEITTGEAVYCTADGKVTKTAGSNKKAGIALRDSVNGFVTILKVSYNAVEASA